MEHLLARWQSFAAAVRDASHVLLLADYDGTLTPIVGRPGRALLAPAMKDRLLELAANPRFTIGVISGRSIAEIKQLVGIEGIYYSGNHGLEIEGPGLKYVHAPAEAARTTIHELAARFSDAFASLAGVIIQDKGLSLSVHYRLVKSGDIGSVRDTFNGIALPLVDSGKITVFSGKKVLEVKPPLDWHKGKAVDTIRSEIQSLLKTGRMLTVFLGDDITDEDGFKVLRHPDGWSVFIGDRSAPSVADFYLRSVEEVAELLDRLLKL